MSKTKIELSIKDYKKLKKLAEKEINEWVKFLMELENKYEQYIPKKTKKVIHR